MTIVDIHYDGTTKTHRTIIYQNGMTYTQHKEGDIIRIQMVREYA